MISLDELTPITIEGRDIPLHAHTLGDPSQPPLVLLHGLRDTPISHLPVLHTLRNRYRIIMPDLRGHGATGADLAQTPSYAMGDFLLDLHAVVRSALDTSTSDCDRVSLFGHSLGGQISSRYAALFPEHVRQLMVVEGLGPPDGLRSDQPKDQVIAYRNQLLRREHAQSAKPRTFADIETAVQRILHGNRRLTREHAQAFMPYLLTPHGDGYTWSFDSDAISVFMGEDANSGPRFWQQVQARVCVVSGALSFEYWGDALPRSKKPSNSSGRFAPGEMEARAKLFKHSEHHWCEQSGHMVHYDEPDRLAAIADAFFT